jgi:hypothetical protein
MKRYFVIIGLMFISFFSFSQSKEIEFTEFTYYTPKKDTLFLQSNNSLSYKVSNLWEIDTFITEPKPIMIYHSNVQRLKADRIKKDWYINY